MRKRNGKLAIAALGVALLLGLAIFSPGAIPTGSWGLSFQQEGAAPIGNATPAQLARYDAAYLGDTGKKVLYLTFDAGYENGSTAKILDALKKHNAPAAFFLVGNYLQRNGDLVRRMVEEGHIVGNHTMHHRDMSALTDPAVFQKELTDLEELYQSVTGKEISKFYRPPPGDLQRGEPEGGPGHGLQDGFLEPGLCGLEQRCPAHSGAGFRQAAAPDP